MRQLFFQARKVARCLAAIFKVYGREFRSHSGDYSLSWKSLLADVSGSGGISLTIDGRTTRSSLLREARPPQTARPPVKIRRRERRWGCRAENWLRKFHIFGKMGLDEEPARVVSPCRDVQSQRLARWLPDGPDVRILKPHTRKPRLLNNHALPLQRAAGVELIKKLTNPHPPNFRRR